MRGLLGNFLCDSFGSLFDSPPVDRQLEEEIERAWNDPAARIWIDDGVKSVTPIKGGFLVHKSLMVPAKKPCTHQHTFRGTCLYCGEENVE